MKVGELQRVLSTLDPNLPVVVDGYESGLDDLPVVLKIRMLRNENKDCCYLGPHEAEIYDENNKEAVDAVLLPRKYDQDDKARGEPVHPIPEDPSITRFCLSCSMTLAHIVNGTITIPVKGAPIVLQPGPYLYRFDGKEAVIWRAGDKEP